MLIKAVRNYAPNVYQDLQVLRKMGFVKLNTKKVKH